MDDRQMKQDWQNTADYLRRSGLGGDPLFSDISNGRRRTSLDALIRRYTRFAFISLIMGAFMMFQIQFVTDFKEILTFPGIVAMCVIFFICGFTDIYLRDLLRSIDIQNMTVSEVALRCRRCRKIHLIFIAVMLPIAVATVTYIVCANIENIYLCAGMITGGVCGLCIGLLKLRRFLEDYRTLL